MIILCHMGHKTLLNQSVTFVCTVLLQMIAFSYSFALCQLLFGTENEVALLLTVSVWWMSVYSWIGLIQHII